jgi:hypothetical protein
VGHLFYSTLPSDAKHRNDMRLSARGIAFGSGMHFVRDICFASFEAHIISLRVLFAIYHYDNDIFFIVPFQTCLAARVKREE